MSKIASFLRVGSDHTAFEGEWITLINEAFAGVTAEEEAWKPTGNSRSLWEIALHSAAWTEWATHFLRGDDIAVMDWPPTPTAPTADAWSADQTRLTETLAAFGEQISATPDEDFFRPLTPEVTNTVGFTGVLSILIHNAYHAGQVTKLREQYAATKVKHG